MAARVIQEELLKDFSATSELSNWFGREDANPAAVVVKKPNPRNIQNTDKIKELEEQIQRYAFLICARMIADILLGADYNKRSMP